MRTQRKFLALLMALCLTLSMMPMAAFADGDDDTGTPSGIGKDDAWDVSVDGDKSVTAYLTVNNGDEESPTYTLHVEGSGAIKDYKVNTNQSQTGGYYKVTDSPWLSYVDKITEIDLSTGITKIGQCAFNSCAITELPWSGKEDQYTALTEIGAYAFAGCTALTSVSFVPSVKTYGNFVFEYCTSVTSIDWTNYYPDAKESNKLNINGVLVSIGLFADCSALGSDGAKLSLPERITGIDRAAFRNTGYTSIDFSTDAPGVKVIEEQAFGGSKLASIILPDAETHADTAFGTGAFSSTAITSIDIPYYAQSSANVGAQMFQNCSSLATVSLGEGITSIGKNAFQQTAVSTINWPETLTTINDYAFGSTSLTTLNLPSAVKTIGRNAFYNASLQSVVIGASEVSIGYAAFASCSGLAAIDLTNVETLSAISSSIENSTETSTGSMFNSMKDGSVIYVKDASLIASNYYHSNLTAIVVADGAAVDTTKSGLEAVTKENYTAKWYDNAECTGTSVDGITKSGNNYPTYYAKWFSEITLDPNGGTLGENDSPVTVEQGKSFSDASVTLPTPTKDGYNFGGWYTENGTKVEEGTTPNGNATYTARWVKEVDGVTYYVDPTIADMEYTGQALTPNVTVTKNGNPMNDGYTVTYQDNVNAGTATAIVTLEGETPTEIGRATFTITPAKLTITADSKTIYVGDSLPTFTYTVTGLAEGDSLNTEPSVTVGTDTNVDKTGTYTITASGANAGNNYTIAYVTGTLTVKARTNGGGSSSSSTTTYNVAVDTSKNGTVSVSPKNASKGTTVTITAKPNDGYEVDEVIVTNKNGDTVKVTAKGNDKYTFVMPAGKVDVEVTFVKEYVAPSVSFTDVKANAWYYDAALYAAENGLMSGTGNGAFSPDMTTSRAMIWTILARVDGQNISVTYGNWYDKAQSWAIARGVSDGTSPNAPITREQLAVMLYGFAKDQGYVTTGGVSLSRYVDASDVSSWAVEALEWAVGNGLISSMGNNILAPTGTATRAQVAVILMNFCETIVK